MEIALIIILMIYNLLTLYLSITLCSKYVTGDCVIAVVIPVILITLIINLVVINII
jgi:hypothetical protein